MFPRPLVETTDLGLYCPAGDFHIDPWQPVARAIITHAHGDHARPGSDRYLTEASGRGVLQVRLGSDARVDTVRYGETLRLGEVQVSLHPAGHMLGSAQIRIERSGQVCVVSGDYKTADGPTARPFEPLRCHDFISECTFGLPIYRWAAESRVITDIHEWWRGNQQEGRTSILLAYSLGKSQRVLTQLDPAVGPILAHGAVLRFLPAYAAEGISFPEVAHAGVEQARATSGKALVLAPPGVTGSTWLRKFGLVSIAMVSGWMQIRGTRRRKGLDRGFVLSDHADWPGLNEAIAATGAERIGLTHGNSEPLARWLRERGLEARTLETKFSDESGETDSAIASHLDEPLDSSSEASL